MRQRFHIDFIKNSKKYFALSLGIMLICLILNIFFLPTQLDIQFTGGAIMKYSYSGNLTENEISKVAQAATKEEVTFQFSKNMSAAASDKNANILSIELTNAKKITPDEEKNISDALQKAFPKNNFERTEITSIDPSKGGTFFLKCMVAVAMAALLMIVYVGIRFRKIGGLSAGCTAVIALIHDIIMVYFAFVIFRMPLDDNFIAVILTILGYSLNDTIVVYDRIRENRRLMGPKVSTAKLVNDSMNQTLSRTICTSVTTLLAIGSVLVIAIIYDISTVISFALPMMIGIIFGCYSSVCISAPIWVMWTDHRQRKKAEKKGSANSENKKAEKIESKSSDDTGEDNLSEEKSSADTSEKESSINNNVKKSNNSSVKSKKKKKKKK